MKIPFNRPYMTGKELHYISQAHFQGVLSGNGPFTRRCHAWLQETTRSRRAFLTASCTTALEMSAVLLGIGPGDEVIMPSYTFVSTANAFVLRGAIPVFVDIRDDTLNIDETKIEEAITERTKAVVPVHYAGVACEMDSILNVAGTHGLYVVEDAAQALRASYKGRELGSMGDLGALSFHETKNVISGEGGALLVNRPELDDRAEMVWEKGTDRSSFFRGEVDKYTWRCVGSSYPPSELTAAFLWAQLEEAEDLTAKRLQIWKKYHAELEFFERRGKLIRPVVPDGCAHNAHIYHIRVVDRRRRDELLKSLNARGVNAVFHYVPLHNSPAGKRYGRASGELTVTEAVYEQVIRLPLYVDMTQTEIEYVLNVLAESV